MMTDVKLLGGWTQPELRSVIRFLWAQGLPITDMHKQLQEVYGKGVMSRQHVAMWCRRFAAGRTTVSDEKRAGRPTTSSSELNVERVRECIRVNPHFSVRDVADTLCLRNSAAYYIIHNVLRCYKDESGWVCDDSAFQSRSEDFHLPEKRLKTEECGSDFQMEQDMEKGIDEEQTSDSNHMSER